MSKKFETKAIRTQLERSQFKEHSVPLYMTSSYRFDQAEEMRALFASEREGNVYSRYSNPNITEFIQKIVDMEGAEAGWATASGMAAVFTTFAALLEKGDHILSCRSIFGSTHQLLQNIFPKWGIATTYADSSMPDLWEQKIQPNTKLIYAETPSNPAIDILDLEWLGNLAKKHNLILVIDNCFATPYIQKPIEYGTHLSIHSATKYLDGQGRTMGGVIVGNKELIDQIEAFARHSGPALSPFNAWILSKSLETLAIRMERHSENALKLAQFLEKHPKVDRVRYPFLPSHPQYELAKKQMRSGGGIVSFYIKGAIEQGKEFLDQLKMISLSANLGDSRSIATHPASTTHAKLTEQERLSVGIQPNLVRISAGLEHIDDIIEDIDKALKSI